jgi:hypothetical protein
MGEDELDSGRSALAGCAVRSAIVDVALRGFEALACHPDRVGAVLAVKEGVHGVHCRDIRCALAHGGEGGGLAEAAVVRYLDADVGYPNKTDSIGHARGLHFES